MLALDLLNAKKWQEFLEYKSSKDFVNEKEKKFILSYISETKYYEICSKIINSNYTFSIPKKHLISKGHSKKKRAVYNFNEDEMMILKYISYLLYEYDYLFSPNLYSFRKNTSVKNAIRNLSNIHNLSKMYGYKVDISNYFNSINIDKLLANLRSDLKDEPLFNQICNILKNPLVSFNGIVIEEKDKGVMAGTPISAFLANYYIKEIDEYFWNKKIVYLRYADDIIMFANTKEELLENVNTLKSFFKKYLLNVNEEKEYFIRPHDKWEFLGFSFYDRKIDVSENSIRKIKGKIRRSARGIRRWMLKKDANFEIALKAMNRKYNKKFFGKENKEELSWKYWFFPAITTSESLKIIDKYMQEQERYIVTGRHNKMNYKKVPYSMLKKCNYKSLVSEYFKTKAVGK